MKNQNRLFRRKNGIFFLQDNATGKQESLRTRDKQLALRILHARNEANLQPAINQQIARAYLMASDPMSSNRDWQYVMKAMSDAKGGNTRARWERAMREKPFDKIRELKLIETRADHFLEVLNIGTVSTNIYLRRLHNFALEMDWIAKSIIPRRQWPKIQFQEKRAITFAEHQKILGGERNPEWRAYYHMLWSIGGSQSDVAQLCAEDVDWTHKVISFSRMKAGSLAQLHFGPEVENLLNDLPSQGLLFPRIANMTESDRASLFSRRCRLTGVNGVTLHSYRYAWAERAMTVGYPERFAQEALGHRSKSVHRAYAKRAQITIPSLEDYERAHQKNAVIAPTTECRPPHSL